MENLHYNIHDLFSFQVKRVPSFLQDAVKDMRMHYHYFSDGSRKRQHRPDLEVHIGPFTPDLKSCYSIDRKYYVRQDYLYYREIFRSLQYAVCMQGLETGNPKVQFQGNVFGLHSLLAPNVIVNDHVIQPLLEVCLNQLGHCLIHCAGVASEENAYLFAGRGGSRKTTLAMEFVRRGMRLIGDDYLLLGEGGRTYSFPTNHPVFEYRVKNLGVEEMSLLDKLKAKRMFKADQPSDPAMAGKSNAVCLFLIYPKRDGDVRITPANKEEALDFLLRNNLLEMMHSPFYLGMLAYRLMYPNSFFSRHHETLRQNLRTNLPDIPVFKLAIPLSLGPEHIERIVDQVKKVCP